MLSASFYEDFTVHRSNAPAGRQVRSASSYERVTAVAKIGERRALQQKWRELKTVNGAGKSRRTHRAHS